MLLSLVTINYKRAYLTIGCLKSLYKLYAKQFNEGTMELIIVDNDSQDDSVAELEKVIKDNNYKNISVLANTENAGFSKGCNTGAAATKGEYILFINNDTIVKDNGILAMVYFLRDRKDIAILGGQLRNDDGTLQPSTGNFYTLGNALLLLSGGQRLGILDKNPKSIKEVEWVKGGLMMVRRKEFEELKGFDEKIFMYAEDMELCYRAHKAGKKVYFYPNVDVMHKDQGSSNKAFAIVNIYKNLLYFYKKHRSPTEQLLLRKMLRLKAKSVIAVGKSTKNMQLVETYKKALAETN